MGEKDLDTCTQSDCYWSFPAKPRSEDLIGTWSPVDNPGAKKPTNKPHTIKNLQFIPPRTAAGESHCKVTWGGARGGGRRERTPFGPGVRVILTSVRERPEDWQGSSVTAAEKQWVSSFTCLFLFYLTFSPCDTPVRVSQRRSLCCRCNGAAHIEPRNEPIVSCEIRGCSLGFHFRK